MVKENIRKNTIWNMIGVGINAFSSLFFMIFVTRINGVDEAGVFTFAFTTATLFNVIGTYAGRIYQVTERKNISNTDFIINRLITCLAMLIVTMGYVFIKGYSYEKSIIIFAICIWKMLEAFADCLYGFMQKSGNLYKVGISFTLKNIIGLICFIIIDIVSNSILLSVISFIACYILIMFFYDFIHVGKESILGSSFTFANVMDIFKYGFPTFVVTFLNMYLINASKYSIDSYLKNSDQTIYGIIVMPATVMILIAQFVFHPYLNIITLHVEKKDYKSINKLMLKIASIIILLGILAVVFCYFVGIYILQILYGVPLLKYNGLLSWILIGAVFCALTSLVITVLIAMRYTVIQMLVYAVVAFCVYFVSDLLVKSYGLVGAVYNYVISMFVLLIAFFIVYRICANKEKAK